MRNHRAIVGGAFFAVILWATPVVAQQMLLPTAYDPDRLRVSGFWYSGDIRGTIEVDGLSSIPGFDDGIDLSDDLGVERGTGFLLETNVAAARRHRFIWALSRVRNQGFTTFSIPTEPPPGTVDVDSATETSFRETHGFYNFLFIARNLAEVGVLAGVGHFDVDLAIDTSVGGAMLALDQTIPALGANVLFFPGGQTRIYVEFSGFPSVEVGDLSGSQYDFTARLELFPQESMGILVGYRRYGLSFDDVAGSVISLAWDTLLIGGQARF